MFNKQIGSGSSKMPFQQFNPEADMPMNPSEDKRMANYIAAKQAAAAAAAGKGRGGGRQRQREEQPTASRTERGSGMGGRGKAAALKGEQ